MQKTATILILAVLLSFNASRPTVIKSQANNVFLPSTGIKTNLNLSNRSSKEEAFLEQLARDTWMYLSSDWATDNHLPWSWRSYTLPGGSYANPAEIGLYALSWLAAYDFQRSWSPTWLQTESEVTAILDQLRAWQTGSQSEQPNGPNAYLNSVFYQGYWISSAPPTVGSGTEDHVVPSIDNAWLAVSLITIREYAKSNNHPILANKADAILSDMDFTLWYDIETHRFFWGDVDNPQGVSQADYYSNENRIINFVARALEQLNTEEYLLSLGALEQPSGTYAGITVDKVAWDGSYFTYTTPALFIREMDTPYGTDTIMPATQAQIAYAKHQGYNAWGFSDSFDIGGGGYVQQGAPPIGMSDSPEARPGLVAPYASALNLITPLSSEAITNLHFISDTFICAYDRSFGFLDSVKTDPNSADYGKCSERFSALAQEWIFLAISNHMNTFIWENFYRADGVIAAHLEMFANQKVYLPIVLKNFSPLVVVADFNECTSTNNLGGGMGAAYNPPDLLVDSYVKEQGRGCVARLEYQIINWSAFWIKLLHLDLTPYSKLVFDIKSSQTDIPAELKIELKRAGNKEVSIVYVSGFSTEWQTLIVDLKDFGESGYAPPLSSFTEMEELVFTFEANRSGKQGIVYLDNIIFER